MRCIGACYAGGVITDLYVYLNRSSYGYIWLYISKSICIYQYQCTYTSIYVSLRLPIYISIDLPVCLSIYRHACLSVCLAVCLSVFSMQCALGRFMRCVGACYAGGAMIDLFMYLG